MSKINSTKELSRGNWLTLNEITYETPDGKTRTWESVSRTTKSANHNADAVSVIPILKRALHHDCFVTVKQFRPPLNAYTIEFPAGLIDHDDSSIETSALRELREETGYVGKITQIYNEPSSLDAGVLGTTLVSVIATIDGDVEPNTKPVQKLDETEFVEVILVPMHDFAKHLQAKITSFKDEKVLIDSRMLAFAMGLQVGENMANKRNVGKVVDDSPLACDS